MSANSSAMLPGPLRTMSVRPEMVVTVAPEATDVDPSVGALYEEIPVTVAPVKSTAPVNVGEASGAFRAIAFVSVVENAASLPSAVANSLRVFSVEGAEATRSATAVPTNAVVATCVVFVPADAVGAVGVPVSAVKQVEP